MKKSLTKMLSLVVAVAMLSSILCVTSFAEATITTETVAEDNFDSYDQDAKTVTTSDGTANLPTAVGTYVSKINDEDAPVWFASSNRFGVENAAKAGIVQNPTKLDDTDAKDNVLAIEGRVAYTAWNQRPRVIYQNLSANYTDKYTYKFDIYKGSNGAGGGIIFNFGGDNNSAPSDTTYYALDFVGKGDHAYGYEVSDSEVYSTALIKNGARVADATITSTTGSYTQNGRTGYYYVPHESWLTVEVTVDKGVIGWTVTDENSAVIQTGTWTDPNPITTEITSFSLFAGGQYNTYTYFDNVSVEKTTIEYDEPEVEAPENAIIYDDFDSYTAKTDTSEYSIGADTIVAGRWTNKTVSGYNFGGWSQSAVGTAVVANPTGDGNAITINAQTGWEGTSAANQRLSAPSVEYAEVTMNQDDVYNYKFDIYRTGGSYDNAGGGIRFNVSGKNFYELYFMGNNGYTDGTYKTALSKLESGVYTRLEPEITSTLTNNMLSKQTWYTVDLTVEQGEINWTVTQKSTGAVVQTGSYTDAEPFRGSNFTMRLFAAGQGGEYVTFDNVIVTEDPSTKPSLDDIHVAVEGDTYIYADKFAGYDANDGAVGGESAAVRANKADRTILKNDAGSWKLSDVHSWQGFPGAFVNETEGRLELLGHQGRNTVVNAATRNLHYPAVVNFDPAGTGSIDIKELSITGGRLGATRYGIRVAVSEDENSYYELGRGDLWDYREDVNPNELTSSSYGTEATGLPKHAPYILKCVDGVSTMVAYSTDVNMANDEADKTWNVAVDGTTVTVTVTSTNATNYTYTFEDTDGLFAKSAYPLAVYSSAGAYFDGLTMKYVPGADVFVDNGDGTATITAVPARYLETESSLKLVTSFYDANGGFISASENTLAEKGSYNINTAAGYSYAKVMMYDGDKLVKEISTKEDVITVAEDKIVVACVGDSNTGNGGQTTNDTWSTRIGAMLGEDYDVQNYGRAGYRLMSGFEVGVAGNPSYIYSEEYAASLTSNPDIVIIMLGTNDGSLANDETKRATFKSDYLALIDVYQNLPTNPEIIITVPPIRGTAASPNNAADSIRPVIQEISQELGLRYVDMTALVTDYDLLYDTLHFKDAGYFQFADHFYNAVKRNVTTTVSEDNKNVVINTDSSFDSDIAVAVYKDGKLTGVRFVEDAKVLSATDYSIDVSDLDIANGDMVKVMILDDQISPYTYAQTIAGKSAYVSNGKALITGNTTPEANVGVTVYSGDTLVYADSKNADRSGYYSFNPALAAGTYTVKTSAGVSTTLTVE